MHLSWHPLQKSFVVKMLSMVLYLKVARHLFLLKVTRFLSPFCISQCLDSALSHVITDEMVDEL